VPAVLVRRDGRSHAPVLCRPGSGRGALPDRLADHGLQRLADDPGRRQRRDAGSAAPGRGRRSGSGGVNGMSLWKHHEHVEKNSILLLILILITVSIGGIVEIVPLYTIESTIEEVEGVRPYSPLELAGRNIYIREGCYSCHSQQVRPFRDEVERYGHYSLAAESMYDHPFQWGSKRTGPDMARVGGKYSAEWHVAHMIEPQAAVPESIMPPYRFLIEKELRHDDIADHLRANRAVGVPYTDEMIENA